ncbi:MULTISPECIES: M28 family peptidase [Caldilinea]|jgi:glutaminyl-peptide cyclotransferase|uniref:Peptidase M28 family protein n=1 Tax=Caldilinea aerophila (strain DSM 14535 / JCM 11387 / NBRC 104270 / STL-6-O1) TaxID=926550 RepID=I0I3B7_CALAS|nr:MULTISPECIES: M28 family peptidase [Caldilinea]MBO9394028.1 M28 family peptidase [Caldilinea sp.]BAL99754.1 peptidase M28 family protein [Caldilinea aerophila DSM 14535 = NBRC 104270]GIV73646.1 MAG: glutamine cyclotransferase [Caldilinea sp.]
MQRIRAYSIELILVTALLAAIGFFGYLAYGLLRPDVVNETFSGEKALALVARQLDFGPRITGTEASLSMGNWLVEQLRLTGWDVVIQPFTINEQVQGRNIIAVRSPASRPGAPVIILATHYDSRITADADPDPAQRQQPTPGANAGASGAAILLELARTLDLESTQHTVCLAFFDAEANEGLPGWEGHIGSQLFVESLPNSVPRCASPRYVVGVEQAGAVNQRFFRNDAGDEALSRAIWRVAANLQLSARFPDQTRTAPTTSTFAFASVGIPTVDLIGVDYPYRATLADTLDKISAETLGVVGLVLETWLESRPQ